MRTTVSALVPAHVKDEAAKVIAAHGLSFAAACREMLRLVAVRDPETWAWLESSKALNLSQNPALTQPKQIED